MPDLQQVSVRLRRRKRRVGERSGGDSSAKARFGKAEPAPAALRSIRQKLRLDRDDFSRLTGISVRNVAKIEAGEPVGKGTLARMIQVQRLGRALAGVIQPHVIGDWLMRPNPGLRDLTPIE